jgi:predicted restriction endonuclease
MKINNFQIIIIDEVQYYIIDSINNLRAEDSFIHPQNKLELGSGAGERRKYVGSFNGESGKKLNKFFLYSGWGKDSEPRTYPEIQKNRCFFSKDNLLEYIQDASSEYQVPQQVYKRTISNYYNERLRDIKQLENERIFFSIHDVSDFQNEGSRAYIRSRDPIWDQWRKLVLPKISYLSILKLIEVDQINSNPVPLFHFRIYLDYEERTIIRGSIIKKEEPVGDDAIRDPNWADNVRDIMPQCPFTLISESRLHTASHIKPWKHCVDEGVWQEQGNDPINGLILTPTYDRLFDRGYISFNNDGSLICTTQFSGYIWNKLNINPSLQVKYKIYPEERSMYLQYHREKIFRK